MKKKRIFISGGSGMVGKNLVNHINSNDYEILATSSSELNLLNKNEVDKFLLDIKPDIIIHAAGTVGGIHKNIEEPVKFLSNNMLMGFNLINSALENGIKNFLNLGSSCMYPKNIENIISEDMLLSSYLEPTNEGYALAKISTTKLCCYINREYSDYFYKTIVPCNLYGPYDSFNPEDSHLLPSLIFKLHNAKVNNINEVTVWGDGKAKREFMYVEDLSNFIYSFIDKLEQLPEILNVGIGRDWTVEEYYLKAADIIGFEGKLSFDLSKPSGMKRKLLDVSQVNELGWKSSVSLSDGISKTYKFFLSEYKK